MTDRPDVDGRGERVRRAADRFGRSEAERGVELVERLDRALLVGVARARRAFGQHLPMLVPCRWCGVMRIR